MFADQVFHRYILQDFKGLRNMVHQRISADVSKLAMFRNERSVSVPDVLHQSGDRPNYQLPDQASAALANGTSNHRETSQCNHHEQKQRSQPFARVSESWNKSLKRLTSIAEEEDNQVRSDKLSPKLDSNLLESQHLESPSLMNLKSSTFSNENLNWQQHSLMKVGTLSSDKATEVVQCCGDNNVPRSASQNTINESDPTENEVFQFNESLQVIRKRRSTPINGIQGNVLSGTRYG